MPYKEKEKAREYGRKWYASHKPQFKEYRDAHREQRNEQQRQWRLNHKEETKEYNKRCNLKEWLYRKGNNLCQDCGKPIDNGKCYCEEHLKARRDRRKLCYYSRKEQSLCTECGAPAIKGMYCAIHLSKCVVRGREYNDRPLVILAHKRYKKEKYHRRKSENVCTNCGMPLNEESRMGVFCLTCYSIKKGYY